MLLLGKKSYSENLHNLAAKQKGSTDLKSLFAVFQECNGPDLELRTDENGIVTGIFFQDYEMKRFFSLYPELLLVDATYKLTNLRMPLYLLLVVGPNGESEIAAIFLTASEDCVSLSAMFEIFKEKNINWSKISSVFTDKDMTERECIKHAFPQINLLLCIFHVLRCMSREITTSKMNISEAQRLVALKALQKMTYATTEKEYEKLHDEFHKVMPPPIVKYVEVNWHACRFEWVRCWQQQIITFGECTTNRLESINRRIKAVVSLLSPLPIFFKICLL
ncbi:zinc finger SWIM domain-containing protein 1-like [Hydra vulgaris]|uniref:zinc finger SWIM domain-containing protein 1-like n=1 Tax=Hydra vulgaris TaxID=6087 RepID=UPI0032E9DC4D